MTFNIKEDATTGTEITIVYASDRDETPDLQLSINWEHSKFYKNRAIIEAFPEEWKKTFAFEKINPPSEVSLANGIVITTVKGIVKVGDACLPAGDCANLDHSPLDRETFDSVELCLTAIDLNTDLQQPIEVTKDQRNLYNVSDLYYSHSIP